MTERLISADKLLEWLEDEINANIKMGQTERVRALQSVDFYLKHGRFDLDQAPVPEINPENKVRHKDHPEYGIGVVSEISKSGKSAYVEWPNYDANYYKYGSRPYPAYYRLDKLIKVEDET